MKKMMIAAATFVFAAVSFAAQTPAKPAASNSASNTSSTAKKHHSGKKGAKPAAKTNSPSK